MSVQSDEDIAPRMSTTVLIVSARRRDFMETLPDELLFRLDQRSSGQGDQPQWKDQFDLCSSPCLLWDCG